MTASELGMDDADRAARFCRPNSFVGRVRQPWALALPNASLKFPLNSCSLPWRVQRSQKTEEPQVEALPFVGVDWIGVPFELVLPETVVEKFARFQTGFEHRLGIPFFSRTFCLKLGYDCDIFCGLVLLFSA